MSGIIAAALAVMLSQLGCGGPSTDTAATHSSPSTDCTSAGCDAGSMCVTDRNGQHVCAKLCSDNSNCSSGCCTTTVGGANHICAPTADYCGSTGGGGGGTCATAPAGSCSQAGQEYCGGGTCCLSSSPYYCAATNLCYTTASAASTACGATSACTACVTPSTSGGGGGGTTCRNLNSCVTFSHQWAPSTGASATCGHTNDDTVTLTNGCTEKVSATVCFEGTNGTADCYGNFIDPGVTASRMWSCTNTGRVLIWASAYSQTNCWSVGCTDGQTFSTCH